MTPRRSTPELARPTPSPGSPGTRRIGSSPETSRAAPRRSGTTSSRPTRTASPSRESTDEVPHPDSRDRRRGPRGPRPRRSAGLPPSTLRFHHQFPRDQSSPRAREGAEQMSEEMIAKLEDEIDASFAASFPISDRIRELDHEIRILREKEASHSMDRQRLQMAIFQLKGETDLSGGDANVELNRRSIELKSERSGFTS